MRAISFASILLANLQNTVKSWLLGSWWSKGNLGFSYLFAIQKILHNSLKYNHSRVFFLICIYQDLSFNEKLGYEITRTELEDRGYCGISFFVKHVLDKMSLVEVIVSRLPFFINRIENQNHKSYRTPKPTMINRCSFYQKMKSYKIEILHRYACS